MLLPILFALTAVHGGGSACPRRRGEVVEMSGEVQADGLQGRFVRQVESDSGRLFETQDLGVVTTRNGFDGRVAWSQDMSGGVHDLNSGFAHQLAVSIAWLDGHAGCPATTLEGLTPLGLRREGGRRFNAWKATPPGGVPFELWYVQRTERLDRAFFQMAESRLIRHFGNWRSVGGGRFVAFRQRDEFPEDEDEVVRRVTRVVVRDGVDPAEFAPPAPPKDSTILNNRRSTTVPFEDDHRTRIYIPVMLNGKGPFVFELDSGGHNMLSHETAAALGLAAAGSINSTGAGNAVAQSGIARLEEIRIGDAVVRSQPIQIRDLSPSSNDRSPNPPRAGILGLELFERFIISIDPRAKRVTLSSFDRPDRPAISPSRLVFTEDAPLISGSFGGHSGEFMLDTGNAGPTIIEDYWARPLGLNSALERGVPRGDAKVSLGTVGVGRLQLRNELVGYYGTAERGSEYTRAVAGVYGEPLLSRFNSTYDYSRNLVWLEPLPEIGPLPFDRSGLSLAKTDGGLFKVVDVVSGSPADRAGIRKGDLVASLNGVPAPTLSRADASAMLRGTAGVSVSLGGTFGGSAGSKEIKLRELAAPK